MRAKKVDQSHREIRDALREAGVVVHDCSAVGFGYPDLHCSYRGYSALVECKTKSRGELRESQRDFMNEWQGPLFVALSGDEAVAKFFEGYAVSVLKKI